MRWMKTPVFVIAAIAVTVIITLELIRAAEWLSQEISRN